MGRVARRDHPAVGQDLAGVVEDDHSVAEQVPALLGVAGDGMGGAAVRAVSGWAWGAGVGTWGTSGLCGCGHCGLGFQRKRRMAMNAPAAPQAARTARLCQSNPVCWANGPSRAWLNGRTGKAPEIRFSAAE